MNKYFCELHGNGSHSTSHCRTLKQEQPTTQNNIRPSRKPTKENHFIDAFCNPEISDSKLDTTLNNKTVEAVLDTRSHYNFIKAELVDKKERQAIERKITIKSANSLETETSQIVNCHFV